MNKEELKKEIEIKDLWVGVDFEFEDERYCLLELNGKDKEAIAVKINYDEPCAYGNTLFSFNYETKVIFIPRKQGIEQTEQKFIDAINEIRNPVTDSQEMFDRIKSIKDKLLKSIGEKDE